MEPTITLRDWFAAHETLSDCDDLDIDASKVLGDALGIQRPSGNHVNNPRAWLEWGARIRAAIRYIRADAMIAQSQNEP